MDNQSKVCRACNGNPDNLKYECSYCEVRAEWLSHTEVDGKE